MSPSDVLTEARTSFDRDTHIRPVGSDADSGRPDTFAAELRETWRSATGVHGGYQVAIAVRSALAHSPDRRLRSLSTTFLRPGQPGTAIFTVRELRAGRSFTTLVVDESQDDRLLSTTRLTLTADVHGASWHAPVQTTLVPFEETVPLDPPPGILHFDHAVAVLDPTHRPFADGPLARVGGYVRPLEARPIDAPWLTMIMDWFPPSPFSRGNPPVGAVSVDYSVHLHRTLDRLGDDEWLAGEFSAEVSVGALALERGRLSGPDGALVAESFHTRWTG